MIARAHGIVAFLMLGVAAAQGCKLDHKGAMITPITGEDVSGNETLDVPNSTMLYAQGADLGMGYNMRTGELMTASDCLGPFEVVRTPLNITEKNVMILDSKKQMTGALGIQGTGSFVVGPVSVTISAGFEGAMNERTTSVFVLVFIERKVAEYRVAVPSLRSAGAVDSAEMFQANHADFESKCGDHFIRSIITGGRYIGLIEIETGNLQDKLDISASLAGRFIPLGVGVIGDFHFFLERIADTYRVRIHAASQGVESASTFTVDSDALADYGQGDNAAVEESNITDSLVEKDLKTFFADIDNFYQGTREVQPDDDYRKNALMMTFAGYETAAENKPPVDKSVLLMRQRLGDMSVLYDDNIQRLAEIIRFPEFFENAVDFRDGKPIDKDAMEDIATDVRYASRVVTDLLTKCSTAYEPDCIQEDALATLPIVSVDRLEASLPKPKEAIPSSCTDLKCRLGYREDGDYRVFLNGDVNKPFNVYCKNMSEGNCFQGSDGEPNAYLQVAPYSGKRGIEDKSAVFNFSTNNALQYPNMEDTIEDSASVEENDTRTGELDAGVGEPVDSLSTFDFVPIHINRGDIITCPQKADDPHPGARYGATETALDHGIIQGPSAEILGDAKIMGNIDLSSTPFRIAPDVEWTVHRQPTELLFETGQQAAFDSAMLDARRRGGILATVISPEDIETLASELEYRGVSDAWVGLRCADGDDRYRWDNGKSYDYTAYISHPSELCDQEVCVLITIDRSLKTASCDESHSYFVEYDKFSTHAEVSAERDRANLYVSSLSNSNVLFEPENDLVLEYNGKEATP